MPTERSPALLDSAPVEGRRVAASFDGGAITSNAGALPLGATDRAIGLVMRRDESLHRIAQRGAFRLGRHRCGGLLVTGLARIKPLLREPTIPRGPFACGGQRHLGVDAAAKVGLLPADDDALNPSPPRHSLAGVPVFSRAHVERQSVATPVGVETRRQCLQGPIHQRALPPTAADHRLRRRGF